MTEAETFETATLVNGLYNAHGKTCTSAGVKQWISALERLDFADVERAFRKVAETGEEFPNPARIRRLAMSIVASDQAEEAVTNRCHFHGDGRWERGGIGRPGEPSPNPTMSWCDRCAHFEGTGQQRPEDRSATR